MNRNIIKDKIRKSVEARALIDIFEKRRDDEYVFARAVYFKACKDLIGGSYRDISKPMSDDHNKSRHSITNTFPSMYRSMPFYKNMYLEVMNDFSHLGLSDEVRDLTNRANKYDEYKHIILDIDSIEDEELKNRIIDNIKTTISVNKSFSSKFVNG